MSGPVAAVAAPVPAGVPTPLVVFYQTIVKVEGHITKEIEVKTRVTAIKLRDWLRPSSCTRRS